MQENSTNVFTLQGGILIKQEPKSPETVTAQQPTFATAIQPTSFRVDELKNLKNFVKKIRIFLIYFCRSARLIPNATYTTTNQFYANEVGNVNILLKKIL